MPDANDAAPTGYLLVTVAMVFSAVMIIYARKYLRGYDAYDVGSIRIFTTALAVTPFSLLTVGFDASAVDGAGVLALLYSAVVGTFLGLLLSFYNIKRFGATPAVMTTYIIPIVAGIGGVLLLGEEITSTMLVGHGHHRRGNRAAAAISQAHRAAAPLPASGLVLSVSRLGRLHKPASAPPSNRPAAQIPARHIR